LGRPRSVGMVIWRRFAAEKSASTSRLEPMGGVCFVGVTAVSNRSDSRLEIWTFEAGGILGRRSTNCGANREMLSLPAFLPGGFICSSKRFGAVPFPPLRDRAWWAAQVGRPRAGIASNCVVILRSLCGCVNGTERLEVDLNAQTSNAGSRSPLTVRLGHPSRSPFYAAVRDRFVRPPSKMTSVPKLQIGESYVITLYELRAITSALLRKEPPENTS
jgi:hypothetical protein